MSDTKMNGATSTNNLDRLHGNMGTGELVMSVLAFSGPLVCVSGFITVYYPMVGAGVPMLYIYSSIILVFFAAGFSKMGTVMERPGGFYAYITDGLGRNFGLTAAVLAAVGYTCVGLYGPPLFAIFADNVVAGVFNGPSIPWYAYSFLVVLLTTALAYRRIDLSAKVLFWVMLFECGVIIVFDVLAFANGSPETGGGAMFNIPSIASGGFGVALLLAFGNFFGFEATVIYREECRDPKRTIPRATFIAVIGIGLFYFVAAWAFIAYYGADRVVEAASEDAAILFMSTMSNLTSKIIVDIISIVAATSTFASILSIHNVAARYFYSLGKDTVLPSVLGKVHKKHRSPFVSASMVGIVWVVMILIFVLSGKPAEYLYPLFSGSGTFMITIVLFLASVAVIAYFKRNSFGFSKWVTVTSPYLGSIGIALILIVSIFNFDALTGATGIVSVLFFCAVMALAIGSFIYAKYLEKNKPEIHALIGRQNFVDLSE